VGLCRAEIVISLLATKGLPFHANPLWGTNKSPGCLGLHCTRSGQYKVDQWVCIPFSDGI
jgi:hypothetical protein